MNYENGGHYKMKNEILKICLFAVEPYLAQSLKGCIASQIQNCLRVEKVYFLNLKRPLIESRKSRIH